MPVQNEDSFLLVCEDPAVEAGSRTPLAYARRFAGEITTSLGISPVLLCLPVVTPFHALFAQSGEGGVAFGAHPPVWGRSRVNLVTSVVRPPALLGFPFALRILLS